MQSSDSHFEVVKMPNCLNAAVGTVDSRLKIHNIDGPTRSLGLCHIASNP